MKSLILYIFTILLTFTTLVGCSDFNKIVKNDDYDKKLQKAEELYRKESFNRALVLYEQVYQRYPSDDRGELSYFKLGKTYYQLEDFYMSSYYFSNFANRFPSSDKLEESLYFAALSSVANSPAPSLDQEETELAINELQFFISRFPNSRRVDSCNLLMDQMRGKLEQKAFEAVKLYDRMERYNAAVFSAESFLEDYPRSDRRMEAVMIKLDNAFTLADKSVFSKRKERLEKVVEIYDLYQNDIQMTKHFSKAASISEKAGQRLEEVDEIVSYEELKDTYAKSQTASKAKKVEYLEETLKLYYTFVQRYPRSEYLSRAEEIFNRAEKERQNTYSY